MARRSLKQLLSFAGPAPGPEDTGLTTVTGAKLFTAVQLAALGFVVNSSGVTRDMALGVPAVAAARNRIVAAVTSMPLQQFNSQDERVASPLLSQLDRRRTPAAVMMDTIDDLLFDQVSYWHVTKFSSTGFPYEVEHVVRTRVGRDGATWTLDGKIVPNREIIHFEGLARGILVAYGGKPIRDAINLERAAALFSASPLPMGYFTPTARGADPDSEVIVKFLRDFEAARAVGAYGFVPSSLRMETPGLDPEKLQLASSREHAALELARQTGIDPVNLGVSTTSRTYFNAAQTRQDELDFTMSLFTRPVEQRLSMPDITPAGNVVRANYDAFLRTDTLSRYQSYALALNGPEPWLTRDEVRTMERRPPLTDPPHADPAAG